MLSEEEIRKLQPYLQIKIDGMRDLTKEYKESIDKIGILTYFLMMQTISSYADLIIGMT